MTAEEVARMLGVRRGTVKFLVAAGLIPPPVNGEYDPEVVERYRLKRRPKRSTRRRQPRE